MDFTITDAGFMQLGEYLAQAQDGPIAEVGLGDNGRAALGGYNPAPNRTALVRERLRVPILNAVVQDRTNGVQVSIAAMAQPTSGFWCNEIGLYLADGTLFAVASKAAGYFFCNAGEERLVTVETGFETIPAGSLTVIMTAPELTIFNLGNDLNYTIQAANLAAWLYRIEADAAIARINALQGAW